MYNMTAYLVRHGETDYNVQRRLQGQSDIALNDNGKKLAALTAQALREVSFDYAYSSPLIRSLETAEILLAGYKIPIMQDERIQEIAFGEYEGLSCHPDTYNIPDKDFMNFFWAPQDYHVPPGGESFENVIKRTGAFWNELVNNPKHEGKSLLISTHGCALKAILANINHISSKDFWGRGVQENCAVTRVRMKDGKVWVEEEITKLYVLSHKL